MNNDAGCENQDLSGLCKIIRALPSIKTVHVIKILRRFYFGFWFVQGHLYSPADPLLPLTLQKNKQTLVVGKAIQSSVHPNYPLLITFGYSSYLIVDRGQKKEMKQYRE